MPHPVCLGVFFSFARFSFFKTISLGQSSIASLVSYFGVCAREDGRGRKGKRSAALFSGGAREGIERLVVENELVAQEIEAVGAHRVWVVEHLLHCAFAPKKHEEHEHSRVWCGGVWGKPWAVVRGGRS